MTEEHLPLPFVESVENRRYWMACLEFSYTNSFDDSNNEIGEECSSEDSLWLRVVPRLSPSPRLTELIRGIEDRQNPSERPKWSGVPTPSNELNPGDGIPHSLRSQIWPRLTQAYEQQLASSGRGSGVSGKKTPLSYAEVVRRSSSISPNIKHQIEKVRIPSISNCILSKLKLFKMWSSTYRICCERCQIMSASRPSRQQVFQDCAVF